MTNQERKVIEEVSGWLRVFDDGFMERKWVGPPEVKFMVDIVPPHENFIEGVAIRDVDLKMGPQVRVYMPEIGLEDDPNEKLPVILHFHGGGFCVSEPNWFMYYEFYSRLARMGRAIVVSAYLRSAPENRLPAAIDDGFSSLSGLSSLAQSEAHDPWLSHADFGRVFLIGDSAGGNLVHEVGARAGTTDLGPLKLSRLIPIHPGVVRSIRSRSELEMPQTPFLTIDMVDKFLSLALPTGCTKDHPITCPMGSTAPPLSGLNLPPILYCVAEKDLMVDTQMEFFEALKKAGKNVELFMSNNMTHSFYLNKWVVDHDLETKAQTQKLLESIIDFMKSR